MLERRRSPTAKVFEGSSPIMAGRSGDGVVAELGDRGPRLLPDAADLAPAPKIAAPFQTAFDVRADRVAVPSFIHRAARVFRRHPAIGYIAAIASIGIATALQWLARDLYQGTPFLTVYPAVVLTAFLGGYRAGLLSAFLGGLSQWYLFIPEYNSIGVLSYAIDAVLCVTLIEYINRSLEKETEAKEHQTLLKDELRHRIKNLFAIIQSVIRFSLPGNDVSVSRGLIEDRLFGRLQAMFEANQYAGDAAGNVALLDLIRSQIRGLGHQFIVHGRPHLILDPQLTQNFSLILYELVTNSLKYGALSTCHGRVYIDLVETRAGVAFDWAEVDGPIVHAPPDDGSGDGFGSRILGPFARGFCADVKMAYELRGFRYSLRIPGQQRV